jgi:hypothetical protein
VIPTLVARGAREAFELLSDIAARADDATEAWDHVADELFAFEKRWWLTTYGTQRDKDTRPGRDPRLMHETGSLERAATERGASRQHLQITGTFVLLEVTHGLGFIHEARGRPVLGEPGAREADHWAGQVADYILTGSL